MTRFGTLVEIGIGSDAMCCKSELPPDHIKDAKLMMIEQTFSEYTTPESLLKALPAVKPLDKRVFLSPGYSTTKTKMVDGRPVEGDEWGEWKSITTPQAGHWKINQKMFNSLETMQWNQMYNFGPAADGPKPLGAGELKELDDGLVET